MAFDSIKRSQSICLWFLILLCLLITLSQSQDEFVLETSPFRPSNEPPNNSDLEAIITLRHDRLIRTLSSKYLKKKKIH
jgi:hypothetical protein